MIVAALTALLTTARTLHARLLAALTARDTTHLPPRLRLNPARAEARIATTLEWLQALAATLAGDRFFLRPITYLFPRFPGRYPALTNAIRVSCGLPPNPPCTPAQRDARRLRYIRDVFATQPTGVIAARLARRLGIAPTDPAWPTDLVVITQPPTAYAAANSPPRPTQPPPLTVCPPPLTPPPLCPTHAGPIFRIGWTCRCA